MNLSSDAKFEELHRRLQDAEALNAQTLARNAQLEKLIQDKQLSADSSILSPVTGGIPLAQSGFSFSNYAVPSVRSSVLSRSKSTISYPTQMVSQLVNSPTTLPTLPTLRQLTPHLPSGSRCQVSSSQTPKAGLLSAVWPSPHHDEPQYLKSL